MSTASRIPLVCCLAALAASVPAPARADDNLLRGPHPFLKENALGVYALVATGQGDSMGGGKIVFDYGYKLTGGAMPAWLDLAVGVQHATCSRARPPAVRPADRHRLRDAGRRQMEVRHGDPAGPVRRRERGLRVRLSQRRRRRHGHHGPRGRRRDLLLRRLAGLGAAGRLLARPPRLRRHLHWQPHLRRLRRRRRRRVSVLRLSSWDPQRVPRPPR